ncbi:MAG: hypothetical protein SH821_04825 [Phototrophicales bacterium]|nr:hypothetical protein [Phototrophicales bacterium]
MLMNQDVTDYINKLNDKAKQEWQVEVCNQLRQITHNAIPTLRNGYNMGNPIF